MQQQQTVERTIENIKRMSPPESLTSGLELQPDQQTIVENSIAEVLERGYTIIPDFLDGDRLERIRTATEPIFEMTGSRISEAARNPGVQTVHVHNLFNKTRAADELAIDPMVLSIVEGVLGPLFQMSVATAMCPSPGVDAQSFHQDDGHWPIPRPHPFPLVANTLVTLDDFTKENGATKMVPGSHQWGHAIDQETDFIQAEAAAGSLLVWDGAMWHAGGANTTAGQRRRSINLNYNLSWLRQQENQYIGVDRETLLELPERLQRLLGYQKTNFLCGGVDYQDPLDYLKQQVLAR